MTKLKVPVVQFRPLFVDFIHTSAPVGLSGVCLIACRLESDRYLNVKTFNEHLGPLEAYKSETAYRTLAPKQETPLMLDRSSAGK